MNQALEPPWTLGEERHLPPDEDGREQRLCCMALADCPVCGHEVPLLADTEVWEEVNGKWVHSEYGPAQGVCCNRLIVDSWDGCRVYRLEDKS